MEKNQPHTSRNTTQRGKPPPPPPPPPVPFMLAQYRQGPYVHQTRTQPVSGYSYNNYSHSYNANSTHLPPPPPPPPPQGFGSPYHHNNSVPPGYGSGSVMSMPQSYHQQPCQYPHQLQNLSAATPSNQESYSRHPRRKRPRLHETIPMDAKNNSNNKNKNMEHLMGSKRSPPPPTPPAAEWTCTTCSVTVSSEQAYQAHCASHILCSAKGCLFSGSPKIVKGHYQSVHGKYKSGSKGCGFKTITIAVPGCKVQRFKICVGNQPEDIQQWIAERKKRFPRGATTPSEPVDKDTVGKGWADPKTNEANANKDTERVDGLSSLLEGYGSSSEEEDDSKKSQSKIGETSKSYDANNGTVKVKHQQEQQRQQQRQKQQQKGHQKQQRQQRCLLQGLFVNDIARERNLTLQLLASIVDQHYFQTPDKTKV